MKVMHRLPQHEQAHACRKHPLGICPMGYMIHAASELNPETLFCVEKTPARRVGAVLGASSCLLQAWQPRDGIHGGHSSAKSSSTLCPWFSQPRMLSFLVLVSQSLAMLAARTAAVICCSAESLSHLGEPIISRLQMVFPFRAATEPRIS